MRARLLRGLLATLFGAVLSACSPVTQLLVVVRSDLPAERIASVDVEVGAFPSTEPALMRTLRVGASGEVVLPFSFGVVPPRGDVRRRVQITVSARAEDGSVSVTRVVRTGFGEGLTLAVPVFLSASCAAVTCTGESTCIDGVCESPDIDVGELEPVRPGDELAPRDAAVRDTGGSSPPDASVDAGSGTGEIGFPRPTRVSAARDFAVDVVVREILPDTSSGDVVVVLDVRPNTILFGGTEPISPLPTTLVARLDGMLGPRWTFAIQGSLSGGGAAWVGDHIVVCGWHDGPLTPGDLPEMGALDGISTYVVDLDASGRGRGVTRLQSGDEVYCSDVVAGSASVVNVAIELGAMPLMGSIPLSGCPDPRAAVVRFALGESAPVPGGGVGLGAVQRGGLRLASDGEGGYLVGLASVGSGDENLGSSCGAGGPSYSIDVLRLDSGGARLWARRIVELPEISDGALTLDVTRSGDRAVVLAALDAGGTTSFRVLDAAGAEVSPARATPRLALGSRRLADGDDALLQIDDGSLASFDLVGREPDVALCGQTPRGTRSGVVSSFFGMSAPSGFRGVVAGLRPPMSPAGQWVLTSTSVDGDVTACAPDSNGGLWVAPLFPGSGLFFDARTVVGSGLVHLEH